MFRENPAGPLFVPTSAHLQLMIDDAMARCDASLERARVERERRRDERIERGFARAARGRLYDAIQRGEVR